MSWLSDLESTIGTYDEYGNFQPGQRAQRRYGENGEDVSGDNYIGESFQNNEVTLPDGTTITLGPPAGPGRPQRFSMPYPNDLSRSMIGTIDADGNIDYSEIRDAESGNFISGAIKGWVKNIVLPALAVYGGVAGLAALTGAAGAGGLSAAETATGYDALAGGSAAAGTSAAGGMTAAEISGLDLTGLEGAVPDFAAGGYSGAVSGTGAGVWPALTQLAPTNIPPMEPPTTPPPPTPPPPTGSEADWYNDGTGKPIPSGSSIMPDGTIIPPGVPVPPGGVPLNGTIPPGTSVPGLDANGLPNTTPPVTPPSTTPGTSGAPSTTPGTGGTTNWGGLLSSLLGGYGANEQTKAYERIADRSWNAGEASRGRYEASMTPGWDVTSIPGFSGALDASTDSYLRGISAKRGNPAGIGGAQGETMAYVTNNTALPWVNNYQSSNLSAGGLASLSSNAQTDAKNAIASQGNVYGQIGSGISDLFGNTSNNNSTNWLSELAKQFGGLKF